MRTLRAAAAVACVTVVPLVGAGCGGGGSDDDVTAAVTGLYAIDHAGARPTGVGLAPYTRAFRRMQQGCEGTPDDLASSVARVADTATNGSGVTITNLDALQAAAAAAGTTPEDCAGLFVGVEARLEGGALSG